MFTVEQLRGTRPYMQMKEYIEEEYQHLNQRQRAGRLSSLVKKYMKNVEREVDWDVVPDDIDGSFTWALTPEGHQFWKDINDFPGLPRKPVKGKGKPAQQPKKKVGWW